MESANAMYTGGGVYIIQAIMDNGDYFVTDCDSYGFYKRDYLQAYGDDEDMYEFEQKNRISADIPNWKELAEEAIRWIVDNRPAGNYMVIELEMRIPYLYQDEEWEA